jgi:hypothetical protein
MNKRLDRISILLFIIWPFVGFIYSLFFLKSKTSYLVFVLFFVLIGYSFTFQNTHADSYGYATNFIEICKYHTNISTVFKQYINGDVTDIYTFIVTTLVSLVSSSPKVLFAFYGLFFGLFTYLSLRLLVKDRKGNLNIYFFLILLFFAFQNPYSNLNGVRFWTAIYVFFYSLVQILSSNKKWVLGIILTCFIHFSLIFPLTVVLIYFIFNEQKKIYWYLFLISVFSFLFIRFSLDISNLNFFGGVFQDKLNSYASKEALNTYKEVTDSTSLLFKVYYQSRIIYAIILLWFINKNFDKIKKTPYISKLYSMTLLLFTFSNFVFYMPSLVRFTTLSFMFLLYLLYKIYNNNKSRIWKIFILLLVPVFILDILSAIALGNTFLSPTLYYSIFSQIQL